jgi:NTE family protein
LSVGAVNARTGNFVYFDNMTHTIGPQHVVASGSLPPGFPAALIEGKYYWDCGPKQNASHLLPFACRPRPALPFYVGTRGHGPKA